MHPKCSEILNTYIIQRKPEKYNRFFEFSFMTARYFSEKGLTGEVFYDRLCKGFWLYTAFLLRGVNSD